MNELKNHLHREIDEDENDKEEDNKGESGTHEEEEDEEEEKEVVRERGFNYEDLKEIIKIPDTKIDEKFKSLLKAPNYLALEFKSVCLLGLTGHGKSSTCNTLSNSNNFKESANCDSETPKVRGLGTKWMNDKNGFHCLIIDTPGLADSKNRDKKHV